MRLDLETIYAQVFTIEEALHELEFLVVRGRARLRGDSDVDHVVQAEDSEALRQSYQAAGLSLVDGQPLIWLSSPAQLGLEATLADIRPAASI